MGRHKKSAEGGAGRGHQGEGTNGEAQKGTEGSAGKDTKEEQWGGTRKC